MGAGWDTVLPYQHAVVSSVGLPIDTSFLVIKGTRRVTLYPGAVIVGQFTAYSCWNHVSLFSFSGILALSYRIASQHPFSFLFFSFPFSIYIFSISYSRAV